ncbi:hypothetical protein Tco_0453910 [Tanacetum coccineum]
MRSIVYLRTPVANDTSGLVPQQQKESDYVNSNPVPQLQHVSPSAVTTVPSQQELDLLFGPLYDEFFNTGTSSVNKSSSPTDNSIQQDTPPTMNIHPTTESTTPTTTVHAEENNDNQAEDAHFEPYEFVNPFCTPVQELAENLPYNATKIKFKYGQNLKLHLTIPKTRWTKEHQPVNSSSDENPSKPVQIRRTI